MFSHLRTNGRSIIVRVDSKNLEVHESEFKHTASRKEQVLILRLAIAQRQMVVKITMVIITSRSARLYHTHSLEIVTRLIKFNYTAHLHPAGSKLYHT